MAKSVGIETGARDVKLVELEGSYRKTRLTRVTVEPIEEAGDELRATNEAAAVLHALKATHASRDDVVLSCPSRAAVLRSLWIPFTGRDQIRKVIKFEVEGSIHSHSVDDMVVDFHTIGEREGESQVIVAAVPKSELREALFALERHGVEPETVELDAMALYRVAHWCGALTEPVTPAEQPADATVGETVGETGLSTPEGLSAPPEQAVVPVEPATVGDPVGAPAPLRVVMDIGARSIRVLLIAGGQLVDMRTLRGGEAGLVEELSLLGGVSAAEVRHALGYAESGSEVEDEYIVPDDEDELEPPEDVAGEVGEVATVAGQVSPEVVDRARSKYLDRFRRELIRFLASVKHAGPIEAVWITGGASLLPGLGEVLTEVFGREPRQLRVLERLSHDLDEDQARLLEPRIAVAVGLALRPFGGPAGFNFRQEDLAFTRGFDRVKFPLAIACMVALFLVVVYAVKSWRDLQWLEYKYGQTYEGPTENTRGFAYPKFQGYLAYLLNDGWFEQTYNTNEYRALLNSVASNPVFGEPPTRSRLEVVQFNLQNYVRRARENTGVFSDLALESGFAVVVRWAEVLQRVADDLGRFLIMDLDLNLGATANSRAMEFTIALRGADFRRKHNALVAAFQQECDRTDSPFAELRDEGREDIFRSDERGSYYTLRLGIKEQFDPFVPR